MAVPLVQRGVGGEAVEVALAAVVPDPDALAANEDDVERLVVVRAEARLDGDQLTRRVARGVPVKHRRPVASGCSYRTASRRGPPSPRPSDCGRPAPGSAP